MKTHSVKVRRLAGAKMIAYLWQRQCWFEINPLPDDAVGVSVRKECAEWLDGVVKRVEGK